MASRRCTGTGWGSRAGIISLKVTSLEQGGGGGLAIFSPSWRRGDPESAEKPFCENRFVEYKCAQGKKRGCLDSMRRKEVSAQHEVTLWAPLAVPVEGSELPSSRLRRRGGVSPPRSGRLGCFALLTTHFRFHTSLTRQDNSLRFLSY